MKFNNNKKPKREMRFLIDEENAEYLRKLMYEIDASMSYTLNRILEERGGLDPMNLYWKPIPSNPYNYE